MKRICRRCDNERSFEIPSFTKKEKEGLIHLKQDSAITAVKELRREFGIEHANAKFIISHINSEYGKCNRCSFGTLTEEYMDCPKCGALNFNWNVTLHTHLINE